MSTLIEKLERLLHQDLGDIKLDLRAIIEQAKAKQAEPVAYINVEKRKLEWAKPIVFHTALCGSYPKVPLYTYPQPTPDQSARIKELEQILHDPENQPSQYGTMPLIEYEKIVAQRDRLVAELVEARKDAERYRWLREQNHDSGSDLDQAIDQAMKDAK